jgi:hypothetical protein
MAAGQAVDRITPADSCGLNLAAGSIGSLSRLPLRRFAGRGPAVARRLFGGRNVRV